jgi:hypothetical protein
MAEGGSKKTIIGYVSAYLKQEPRTYAEAERDRQAQNTRIETGEPAVSRDSQSPRDPGSVANDK